MEPNWRIFLAKARYEACLGNVEKEQTGTPNSAARAKKALSLGLAVTKRLVDKKRDLGLQQRPSGWQVLLAVAVIDHRRIDLADQLFRRANDVRDLTGGSSSLRVLVSLAPHVGHPHSRAPFFRR